MHRITFFFFLFAFFSLKAQFSHDLKDDKKPFTAEPNFAGEKFRFVVIGDLTGGEESGVFDAAMDRLNELAPDFVISVGDLIEGYTYDKNEILKQWDAFNNSVAKLEMPFFYAAGNHDLTNEMMKAVWKEKYGKAFYSFKAGKTLFLILNVYDLENKGFSKDQIAYFEAILNNHSVNDPVFVVLHDPFWNLGRLEGYNEIKTMLAKRNAIWFCGHEHRYLYREIDGQPHYMLAGFASGSYLESDPSLGVFHNFLHVNVDGSKIRIANLELEGLLPPDIVNDANEKQVNFLRRGSWAKITPSVIKSDDEKVINSIMTLKNSSDFPFEISGRFEALESVSFEPESLQEFIQPNAEIQIPVRLTADYPFQKDNLPEVKLNFTGKIFQNEKLLQTKSQTKWIIDSWFYSHPKTDEVVFSGLLKPAEVEEDWDWTGNDDAAFQLAVMHDQKHLYLHIKIHDDKFVSDSRNLNDLLSVFFQPDTAFNAMNPYRFDFSSGKEITDQKSGKSAMKAMFTHIQTEDNSQYVTLKIPGKTLIKNAFRINLSYLDVDNPSNMDHSVLWWKPAWGSRNDYPQSGIFIIKN
ncbi:MAG: metallophosphoesterase [Bacteroidales bacterium]|nr:metallophosphoesterase [Bacteroidales bacterium]